MFIASLGYGGVMMMMMMMMTMMMTTTMMIIIKNTAPASPSTGLLQGRPPEAVLTLELR